MGSAPLGICGVGLGMEAPVRGRDVYRRPAALVSDPGNGYCARVPSASWPRRWWMQLEFQCQKCEDAFSVEIADLSSDPAVKCPSCGAHGPGDQVEALTSALEEVFAAVTPLRRKFTLSFEIDSEDLPPPYDEAPAVARKAELLDEEESEDEEEEEDEEEARGLDL